MPNLLPAPVKAAGRAGRNTELPEHLKSYKGVWVFVEHDRGTTCNPVSWELMGQARQLADKLQVSVAGVLLGGPDEPLDAFAREAYTYGADRCYIMRDPILKGYRNEPFTKGLTDLVNTHQPEIMLLGATTMAATWRDRSPPRWAPASRPTAPSSTSTAVRSPPRAPPSAAACCARS